MTIRAGRPGVHPARGHPDGQVRVHPGLRLRRHRAVRPGRRDLRRAAPTSCARRGPPGWSMCSAVMHTPTFLGTFDPAGRQTAIDELKVLLSTIVEAGGLGHRQPERVRGLLHASCRRSPRRAADEESRRLLVEALVELGEHAVEVGSTLFLEPLNRYEDYLINTLADAVSVVEEVGSPGVAVIADTYHMSIEEADCAQSILDGRRRTSSTSSSATATGSSPGPGTTTGRPRWPPSTRSASTAGWPWSAGSAVRPATCCPAWRSCCGADRDRRARTAGASTTGVPAAAVRPRRTGCNLNGRWEFEVDGADTGLERGLRDRPLAGRSWCPSRRSRPRPGSATPTSSKPSGIGAR